MEKIQYVECKLCKRYLPKGEDHLCDPNFADPEDVYEFVKEQKKKEEIAAESLVEIINIPETAVGPVIGRGGEQILFIQQQSGCSSINIGWESGVFGFCRCILQGSRPSIDEAKRRIQQVLDSIGAQAGSTGGNLTTIELSIPGDKCGLIIGKNGETIKNLQERLGVKMMLVQDSHQPTMGSKPLRISGQNEKVEEAKRTIEQLFLSGDRNQANIAQTFRGDDGNTAPAPRSIGEVFVPRTSAIPPFHGNTGTTSTSTLLAVGNPCSSTRDQSFSGAASAPANTGQRRKYSAKQSVVNYTPCFHCGKRNHISNATSCLSCRKNPKR